MIMIIMKTTHIHNSIKVPTSMHRARVHRNPRPGDPIKRIRRRIHVASHIPPEHLDTVIDVPPLEVVHLARRLVHQARIVMPRVRHPSQLVEAVQRVRKRRPDELFLSGQKLGHGHLERAER